MLKLLTVMETYLRAFECCFERVPGYDEQTTLHAHSLSNTRGVYTEAAVNHASGQWQNVP